MREHTKELPLPVPETYLPITSILPIPNQKKREEVERKLANEDNPQSCSDFNWN